MRRSLGLPPVHLHAEPCLVCAAAPAKLGLPAKVPVSCVAIISFCLFFSTLLRDTQDLTTLVFNRTDKARVCAFSGPFSSAPNSPVEPFNHPVTFVKVDSLEFGPVVVTLTAHTLALAVCFP